MLQTSISQQTGFAHLSDLPCLKLQYGTASAVISLYGAQVLSYQPTAENEVLWLSPKAQWHNQQAIRGGVPLCWPWFGPASATFNPQNISLPNHGLVRNKMWQVSSQQSSADSVSVTLTLTVQDLPHVQGSTRLQLSVTLNDSLTLTLSCDSVMPQQAALHSYFTVNNLDSALVRPLPSSYQDKVNDTFVDDSSCAATFKAETDRIYHQSAAQLWLEQAEQLLSLSQRGHDATVVWNPWQEKSSKMSDLQLDSYQQFVCVETANLSIDNQALTLSQQLKRT